MKHIILSRTDAVGDLILTLPVARAIKERLPDCQVTMLVSRYTAPLITQEKYLDRVIALPGRALETGQIRAVARDLKKLHAAAIIYFFPRLSLALAGWLAKIPVRVGTGRRAYSMFFNKRINLARRFSGKHELELNYLLAESLLGDLPRHEPHLDISADELTAADRLIVKCGLSANERFLVIHPMSHGSAPSWPLDSFVQLAVQLAGRGEKIMVTGSALEHDEIQSAFRNCPESVVNVAGQTEVGTLKGLICRARMLIAGSTGPLHIATALGTFGVGLYPPVAALSPVRWGPRGGANKLFTPPVDQSRESAAAQMRLISVDEVAAFIIDHLATDN